MRAAIALALLAVAGCAQLRAPTAPRGRVATVQGGTVELADLWADHPLVVIFYRGSWCVDCRKQLAELRAREADFRALGAEMILISSDGPEETAATAARLQPWFLLASDPNLEAIREWGVADSRGPYAIPSTFVVKQGDIVYRYVGRNKKDRPPLDEVLEAVREKK